MPVDRPLFELPLVPKGSGLTSVYSPWFMGEIDILIAEEDGDFLTELILGVRRETIHPMTAVFAETDLLINGWHTADTPQPDRQELNRMWTLLLTASVKLKRKS